MPTARDQVFISYSHNDERWRDDLDTHLKPYVRGGSIVSWTDQQIAPGSEWFKEIQSALANSKVAVLLVSPAFLASDFIHEHRTRTVIKRSGARRGQTFLWVPVRESAYKKTALRNYKAVLDPGKPLGGMTKAKRDQAWVRICGEIEKAVKDDIQYRARERSYVYALGNVVASFPTSGVRKEFAQILARADVAGLPGRQLFHDVLTRRESRHLLPEICWVLTISGRDAYIIRPHNPADFELLAEAVDRAILPTDLEIIVGVKWPHRGPRDLQRTHGPSCGCLER
jgi:hypothetical protein